MASTIDQATRRSEPDWDLVYKRNSIERLKRDRSPVGVRAELPEMSEIGYEAVSEEDIVRLNWLGLTHDKPKVGEFMMTSLKSKVAGQPGVTEVRGRGLMIGIEVTKNRDAVIEECFRRGLLVLGAGPNAIRISPPLIVDEEQAAFAVDVLSEAISAV